MPPIVTSAEIGRPAAEVFACATDPSRFSEWQRGVIDGHMERPAGAGDGPAVGARCVTTRRIGGASRPAISELVDIDPPRLLLILRFYGNMTQAEIGNRLGVSQMQVSRLLRSTLDYLRDRLTGPPADALGTSSDA